MEGIRESDSDISYHFPFSFVIEDNKDFLKFEKIMRDMLGCDGFYCAFFQSAEYINLKHVVRMHSVQSKIKARSEEKECCSLVVPIPKTSIIIILLSDRKTLVIRDCSDYNRMDLSEQCSLKQQRNLKRQYEASQCEGCVEKKEKREEDEEEEEEEEKDQSDNEEKLNLEATLRFGFYH